MTEDPRFEAFRRLSEEANDKLPGWFFGWASAGGVEMTVQQVNGLANCVRIMLEKRGRACYDIGRDPRYDKQEAP